MGSVWADSAAGKAAEPIRVLLAGLWRCHVAEKQKYKCNQCGQAWMRLMQLYRCYKQY